MIRIALYQLAAFRIRLVRLPRSDRRVYQPAALPERLDTGAVVLLV